MELSKVAVLIWICALLGFAVYCMTCAWHVWLRRNSSGEDSQGPVVGFLAWVRFFARIGFVAGGVCLLVAYATLYFNTHMGKFEGFKLTTLRVPEELKVAWTTDQSEVKAGDVVIRYRCAELEAAAEVFEYKLEELSAERLAILNEPLEVDEEIPRKLLEASSDKRHYEWLRGDLEIEQKKIQREIFFDQVTRLDDINAINVELEQLEPGLSKARTDVVWRQVQYDRVGTLAKQGGATQESWGAKHRDLEVSKEEVERILTHQRELFKQREELEQGLEEILLIMDTQFSNYDIKIAELRSHSEAAGVVIDNLNADLEQDMVRARQLKSHEVAQVDKQVLQTEKEIAGIEDTLSEKAPTSGQIVYRSNSPASENLGNPLLVIAPEGGTRLQLRIPRWQEPALREAEQLRFELTSAPDAEKPHFFVERKFIGTVLSSNQLPAAPEYHFVEIACNPPREAMHPLLAGEVVYARLDWWPPLAVSPFYHVGLMISGASALGWIVISLLIWALNAAKKKVEPKQTAENPLYGALSNEYGSEGAMLHVLGSQLRESIRRQQPDRNLIVSAEWALDRYRARAIRLIGMGLGEDAEIQKDIKLLLAARRTKAAEWERLGIPPSDFKRLLKILQTVASHKLDLHFDQEIYAENGTSREGSTDSQNERASTSPPPSETVTSDARFVMVEAGHENGHRHGHGNGNGHHEVVPHQEG